MIKKILYVLFGLFLTVCLTGCFDKKENEDSIKDKKDNSSRLAKLYSTLDDDKGVHMSYETIYNGKDMIVNVMKKGDNVYTESTYNGTTAITLMLDDYSYTLDPKRKTGYKTKLTDDAKEQIKESNNYDVVEEYTDQKDFKTGKMTIDNKEYYYEEYSDNTSYVRFLFDGNKIKYNITFKDDKEQLRIKYTSFDSNIDESVFKVPSDYKITEA